MNNIIGKRIKQAMKLRGLKQADIVKTININKGALSSYISGKYVPKQQNIYKLADVLNVNPGWLMGYNVSMEIDHEQTKILFRTTFNELLNYYKITKEEFSQKNDIDINHINSWLNFKSLPNKSEIITICDFFNIENDNDLFNGQTYHNILEKYNNKLNGPDDRYQFGFILESMLDDISTELNISKEKIKSILFNRENDLNLLTTYNELYVFLKDYLNNKIND